MKAKRVILCNGKVVVGRKGGDHKSQPKPPQTRHKVLAQIQGREVREDVLTGEYHHPAAHVEPTLEPVDLRHTVVSCGRREDDDTDGSDAHWYIPVDVSKSNGSSRRRAQSKPAVRRHRSDPVMLKRPRLTSNQLRLSKHIERERDRN